MKIKKFILKKRSFWFHFIVGYCTVGVWWLIYAIVYFDNKSKKKIENEKTDIIENTLSNKKETEEKSEIFKCKLENTKKYDCHSYIDKLLYLKTLAKQDLYDGLTRSERKNIVGKFYEYNGPFKFECEIFWSEEEQKYLVGYNEQYSNYIFGNIPIKNNALVNEIINEKEVVSGGIYYENGGYYEEYDIEEEKFKHGYDNIEITLILTYTEKRKKER